MTPTMHETLQDRMPEVLRGTDRWTAEEADHLAGCAECQGAWRVVQGADSLGREVEARYDGAATAARVVARLRSAPAEHRPLRWRPLVLLAAAAAVALVVARPSAPNAGSVASGARFLPELDSLTVEELTLVADAVDAPVTETTLIEDEPSVDLDTTQLGRVLRSLEG